MEILERRYNTDFNFGKEAGKRSRDGFNLFQRKCHFQFGCITRNVEKSPKYKHSVEKQDIASEILSWKQHLLLS